VTSAPEAIAAANELGYPVVLKIESDRISHKTDIGGVHVDLRNGDEVAAAMQDLRTRLGGATQGAHARREDGPRRPRGYSRDERDSQLGPFLLFGLGGIFVEVMRDTAVRVHPLTDAEHAT